MEEPLMDGQIWDSDKVVLQLDILGKSYRAVMFRNTGDGLHYVQVCLFQDPDKLRRLIRKLGLTLSIKKLVIS